MPPDRPDASRGASDASVGIDIRQLTPKGSRFSSLVSMFNSGSGGRDIMVHWGSVGDASSSHAIDFVKLVPATHRVLVAFAVVRYIHDAKKDQDFGQHAFSLIGHVCHRPISEARVLLSVAKYP